MRRVTEEMTPERALELLKKNPSKIDRHRVEWLKNKMTSGKWVEDNGQFILVRGEKIINGHHRLAAIAESGMTIRVRIQYEKT